jgi:hypothetical protein
MHRTNRWLAAALIMIVGLSLVAWKQYSSPVESASVETAYVEPAKVEPIAGTDVGRVTLSEEAATRLGIQTAPVGEEQIGGALRKVIPYGALLYDASGKTWTYTSPEPLVFVRQEITVDRIEGGQVTLSDGPTAGTAVVTVGAAELAGTEHGVDEE